MWQKPGQRYKAQVKTKLNGSYYSSKLEASVRALLDQRLLAGEFIEIQDQATMELIPGMRWRADFKAIKPDGSFVLVEAKGHVSDTFAEKIKVLRFMNRYNVEIWKGTYTRPKLDETIHADDEVNQWIENRRKK